MTNINELAIINGFNPRAREGATSRFSQVGSAGDVSIHAPVRARRKDLSGTNSNTGFQSTRP